MAVQHTSNKTPYIRLETGSETPIHLTTFQAHDDAPMVAIFNNPSVADRLVFVPNPYTQNDAELWIAKQTAADRSGDPSVNLLLQVLREGDPETGTLVGCVSLMPVLPEGQHEGTTQPPPVPEAYEVGYYLDERVWGRGIMAPAVKALVAWGKKDCGVGKVFIRVAEENKASIKVVSKIKEFVRDEAGDIWQDWPERKGGGKKKVFLWNWEA